jgi:anaerobic ribonucleoside-triphosphate reductase
MIATIIKRDGRQVPYDATKIADAIFKAFTANNGPNDYQVALRLAEEVGAQVEQTAGPEPGVEQVQDVVESVLIDNGFVRIAKAYILYRAERSRVRQMQSRLMKTYKDITFSNAKESDLMRENANVDGDTAMGAMLKYGSEGAKQFNTMYVLKPEHSEAHQNGDIHIHDLDFYTLTTTCCQIDLIKLFSGGFHTGHGVLREPNDISSYSALACIAIQSNQNDQHGGQSIVNFDYGIAPGVAKTYAKRYENNLGKALELVAGIEDGDAAAKALLARIDEKPKLEPSDKFLQAEYKELKEFVGSDADVERVRLFVTSRAKSETDRATFQSMEALIHNLNTMHSRAGAQTPFSSINYGMDTSPEARMVMRNLLLATEKGLGNGETPIFPIQIFRVKEGINYNPGDPNYDLFQLACRVSAKRLFPNFSFLDAPFNISYYKEGHPETEIAYMGCRTRVIGNAADKSKEISNGRGNLSFTSINLPRLAIRARGDVSVFFDLLDQKLDLVIDQLLERFEVQARKRVRNFPFLMANGVWLDSERLGWDDEIREVIRHGTLSIGFIGLAETLKALIGVHHGESEKAQNLGLEIVRHMRERTDKESARRQMNFTLLATPAEGLTGRFIQLDRAKFGTIEGVTDREYYTNSFHIPVYFPLGAYRKIQLEAPYHALTNAGHITYVELDGNPAQNPAAFEKIVRVMKEAGVGYGSINHPVDRDPLCGHNGIIGDTCPQCGRREEGVQFERIRRITGYLVGTLDRFNNAKRAEEHDRVKHGLEPS